MPQPSAHNPSRPPALPAPRPRSARGSRFPSAILGLLLLSLSPAALPASQDPNPFRGQPFQRLYSLDQIGAASRELTLSFDPIGRLVVIHEGSYFVLNDNTWMDLIDHDEEGENPAQVAHAPDGTLYYGGVGCWGRLELNKSGRYSTRPLRPQNTPDWITSINFTQVHPCADGVLFAGWNGAVYWSRETNQHHYFKLQGINRIHHTGNRCFLTTRYTGVFEFHETATPHLEPVPTLFFKERGLECSARLRDGRLILWTKAGGLHAFDGKNLSPWAENLSPLLVDGVTTMTGLPEGGVALACKGRGVLILSPGGELVSRFDSPEFLEVSDLAAHENGVLWLTTEGGVATVFYNSPVTVFDHRLGLPAVWPLVTRWRGKCIITSRGRLYESQEPAMGKPYSFKLIPNQPEYGGWGLAACGDDLLVGNAKGLYRLTNDGRFEQLLPDADIARISVLDPTHCLLIGSTQIAAIERRDGTWRECAPRVAGIGYPNVVHSGRFATWIELGTNRAARVCLRNGRIVTRVFDQFPWAEPRWINISLLGDIVVLNGEPKGHLCFNEQSESFVEDPGLLRLRERVPFRIVRFTLDRQGNLWGSHERGVVRFLRKGNDYTLDLSTFAFVRDRFPQIQVSDEDNVWLSASSVLYNVDAHSVGLPYEGARPRLVSLGLASTGERLPPDPADPSLWHLASDQRNLSLCFFSGSYARPFPLYEFRLDGPANGWSPLGPGSQLNLPNLRDGRTQLEVRLAGAPEGADQVLSLNLEVAAPWYRTLYAFAGYVATLLGGVWLVTLWAGHHARVRNRRLEELVHRRTVALEDAMSRLEAETRRAAVQTERDRLAGEIHDSIQQGLSGLMLQVDSTLRIKELDTEVRGRLGVARNMISFTRQELQNAIWDLESPLLDKADLREALGRMCALLDSDRLGLVTRFEGRPRPLSAPVNHHLLRMAQEALTNAIKYAEATRLEVSLVFAEDHLLLSVEDNGKGFDPAAVMGTDTGHFGLRGLKHRAAKINAGLEITSAPGCGTRVCVTYASRAADQTL